MKNPPKKIKGLEKALAMSDYRGLQSGNHGFTEEKSCEFEPLIKVAVYRNTLDINGNKNLR